MSVVSSKVCHGLVKPTWDMTFADVCALHWLQADQEQSSFLLFRDHESHLLVSHTQTRKKWGKRIFSPMAQSFSVFQVCIAARYFFLLHIQCTELILQSGSSLPESRERLINEPRGALSLTLALGVKLGQKVSAELSAEFKCLTAGAPELQDNVIYYTKLLVLCGHLVWSILWT